MTEEMPGLPPTAPDGSADDADKISQDSVLRLGNDPVIRVMFRTESGDTYALLYDAIRDWWIRPRWIASPEPPMPWLPTTMPVPWPMVIGEPVWLLFPVYDPEIGPEAHEWWQIRSITEIRDWTPNESWPGDLPDGMDESG